MNDKKYIIDDDQFAYDEKSGKKNSFIKQDSEFFNDDDYVPGNSVRVKRIANNSGEDWKIFINKEEFLVLKGTRFSSKEKEFLRTAAGVLFIIDGAKKGWDTVSEYKRQLQSKI